MAKENTINGGGGASTQSNSIDSKASVLSGYSLSTSVQTVVGAINEIEGKLGIVSYPENTIDNSSNVIRLGKDSPEVIKKKVFGGVPYVIIEPSETWNSEYYSSLLDEDSFNYWYENTIADNTCIYEIYNVLTIPTDEGGGFGIAIRVLKNQPEPGPLAAVVDGPEVSTKPLDFIDMTCVFANNEESILSYELNAWRTTTSVIYTTPPESYPIREGSGWNSAIMGHYVNQADGDYSVAEGYYANAIGNYSHAEGSNPQASGLGSHAEGCGTRAIGDFSHTEGSGTTAANDYEHAEGKHNKSNTGATDALKTRHSVGIGTYVRRVNAHEIMVNGDHYIYGLGGYDGTNATADTTQTLQEVINSKQETITAGTGLEFEGTTLNVTLDTTVFKVVSVLPDSPAQGDENKIHLVPAESTGANNIYTEYAWVNSAWEILGEYTSEVDLTPYLKSSDAESTYLKITDAESEYATKTELATKQNSTDDTLETTSKNIVGAINELVSKPSGVGKVDPNSNGTGEVFNVYEGGTANVASGSYSHAEGSLTTASGRYSHAEGANTTASDIYAHAEGYYSTASGLGAHAEGQSTTASGSRSHAEGSETNAISESSHAEGANTTAVGYASHAEGCYTKTFERAEHAEGSYNKSYDSTSTYVRVIHSVGIGSSDDDRKNAHEIKFNGDHYVFGVGGFDGTNSDTAQTLQEVITGLQASTRTRQSEQTVYTEVPELTADYQIPANDTFVERVYIIPVGDTLYSVTGDSSILWAGGIAPNPSANSVLVVSIVKNLATWNVFMVS